MPKIGKYEYSKSTNPKKKLMVKVNNRTIHFGARSMGHFKDRTGIWKSKDHGDANRRKSFLSRMKGVKKKDGSFAYKDPSSPAYHAVRILW
tara:strand:- start:665 stop:937 length:273 start_codon:yes stop_codon:yes gene_type:complete